MSQLDTIAAHIHFMWSAYMMYFLDKLIEDDNGNLTIPRGYVDALKHQAKTPYANLTPEEQALDYVEALHLLEVLFDIPFATLARYPHIQLSLAYDM